MSYTDEHGFGRVGRIATPTGYAVGDINSYVVLPPPGSNTLVLIDTGVTGNRAWGVLGDGLKQFGFAIEDVSLLLLTHAHPDHCGQAARIREAAGCPVWIHEAAHQTLDRYTGDAPPERLDIIAGEMGRLGVPPEYRTQLRSSSSRGPAVPEFVPDRLLRDGDRVEIPDFDLEVVHTPGHCPDEVVLWQADERLMFSGDHLLPDITPVCLLNFPERPGAERVSSALQYFESLERAEALPVQRAFPSHGDVIDDHHALIASYRLHADKRMLKLERLLADGPASPFELGSRMFKRVWREQLYLVMSEVVGHLDLLERTGRIDIEEREGVLQYALRNDRPGADENRS